ncbi:glycoside hydrolase family 3 N-terminal domain-containing protein [Cryobacterium sp. TMT2-4]|uniref:glycoside hydrolase family 3 N-terminal domain-containing protein n=1 Tax=Cryobacterium sp. TMT2-4 TaxID=1259254 RepID=UPI001F546FBA|nr:glycoside hydrolase family 3 N-terminal domain-containing protein [Cryobacterium sp. TMT2-4]
MISGRRHPAPARRLAALAAMALLALTPSGCTAARGTDAKSGTAAPLGPGWSAGPVAEDATRRLAAMSLTEKVASLLMLHQPGTDAAELRTFAGANGLGGLILMDDNVPVSPEEMRAMTDALSPDPELPLLIGIDQEGGEVSRLPADLAPGAAQLQTLPAPATEDAFRSRSTLLQSVGVSVNFGIVADVTADPSSFLAGRVLGTDPASASARVAAAVTGERARVLSTLKHFPGHGAAPGDSHRSIPSTPLGYQDWLTREAPSFQSGIEAGAALIMFGHLAYPSVDPRPASLSPAWHEILRTELGFDGVTITDDLLMLQDFGLPEYADPAENGIAALAAGNTMLLSVLPANPARYGTDVTVLIGRIVEAVDTGRLTLEQIDDAAYKLLVLRGRAALSASQE